MKNVADYLIEWSENTNWKTHLINTVLQNKEVSIEELTDEIIGIINNNKSVELNVTSTSETDEHRLHINEIKCPININALCTEASCELGNNLNVFYGENGSGKSSYVKVFRKLAEFYYTKEKSLNILPNVYSKSDNTSCDQNICISHTCDESKIESECIDINTKHDRLCQINVFDSDSITPLLNSDLTFSILPQGFNIFNEIISVIDSIKTQLQKKITALESEKSEIFKDSSFDLIREEISAITSGVDKFDKLERYLNTAYPIPDNIDEEIEGAEIKVKELQNTNPLDTIKLLSSQKSKLEKVVSSLRTLSTNISEQNINCINTLVKEYEELIAEEKELNENFSKNIEHIEKVDEVWLDFIRQAKKYYNSIGKPVPTVGSKCVFCGQALSEREIDLVKSCFHHSESDCNIRKKTIEDKILKYKYEEIPVAFTSEDEIVFQKEKLVQRIKAAIDLVNNNKELFFNCIDNKKHIPDIKLNVDEFINDISAEITELIGRIDNLNKSNAEITELVGNINLHITSLKKIKAVYQAIKHFEIWYIKDGIIKNISKIKSKFTTNALTQKSKEAFSAIVQDEYTNTFQEYCDFLKVKNVSIKFTPQKGQTYRSKFVVNENVKITDIMSEGEQKAIALAEFATDLKIRKNFNTTLFDDPVTSFDYKRSELFAKLIYELSKERQIIVFTHNIMFYYFLHNTCSSDKNKENRFFKIDEFDRDNKGLISATGSARLENLKDITGKINQHSQNINSKKCIGDILEDTLKTAYSDIRTWCELIVEEGFLKNIIRRYEPNITFTNVTKINVDFVEYLPQVSELFEKSCRYMKGHSQPRETQNVKASRDEFNIDFELINSLTVKYK